jgi:hypothetical protein
LTVEIKKIKINACCGKKSNIWQLPFALKKEHLEYFLKNNFYENKSYTDKGILYIENEYFAAICPFGTKDLRIKCKNKNCEENLYKLESILVDIDN